MPKFAANLTMLFQEVPFLQRFSKAKSAIKMAHKMMEMSTSVDQETIDKANTMIAELQEMIDSGTPPSEGRVKKLNDLI